MEEDLFHAPSENFKKGEDSEKQEKLSLDKSSPDHIKFSGMDRLS